MQCGTPFVTTEIGLEGIFELSQTECKNEDWNTFINEAISLYTNEKKWSEKQQQGFKTLANRFDKTLFVKPFLKRISTIQNELQKHRNNHFFGQILQHHTAQSTKFMSKWIEEKNK